jgi:curved DNA-binding protein
MEYKDYYKILGVNKTATTDEIKKAYRNLAKKYHPDKTKGDKNLEEKFKEVSEAYEVLGTDTNRKKYDEMGSNWDARSEQRGTGGFDYSKYYTNTGGQGGHQNFEGDPEMFSDFFNNIFGGGFSSSAARPGKVRKGQDYHADMEISLSEAYNGGVRILSLENQKLRIKTKPGTRDKQKIKLTGKGGIGLNGGKNGDLIISIHVLQNADYQRKGNNLYAEHTVDLYTAILGGKIKVSTLNGNVSMKIPAGMKGGTNLRLKGKGMPVYGKTNEYGDLYVKMNIAIPKDLSEKEISLFTELKNLSHEHIT